MLPFWVLLALLAAALLFWLTGSLIIAVGAAAGVCALFGLLLGRGVHRMLPTWNREALGVPTLAMLNHLEHLNPDSSEKEQLVDCMLSASWIVASLSGSFNRINPFSMHTTFGPNGRWLQIDPDHARTCVAMVAHYLALMRLPATDELHRLLPVFHIGHPARKWAWLANQWGSTWVSAESVLPAALILSALNGRFPEAHRLDTLVDLRSTREMARLCGNGSLPITSESIDIARPEHGVLALLPSGRIAGYDGAVAAADYISFALASYIREVDDLVVRSFEGLGVECIKLYLTKAGSLQNDPRRRRISAGRAGFGDVLAKSAQLVGAHCAASRPSAGLNE